MKKPLENTPIPTANQEEYIKNDNNIKTNAIYGYCPECYCNTYIKDTKRGECVCPICGLVLEDQIYQTPLPNLYPDLTDHNRFTKDEKNYIKQQHLHLKERVGGKGTRQYYAYRLVSKYATRLNIYNVDKQNIINYLTKENLSTLHITIEKIILSIMKYIISPRKYQDKRINRGVFQEVGLTTKEYQRVIKHLFQHDTGQYGIVRQKDRTNDYYKWVNE